MSTTPPPSHDAGATDGNNPGPQRDAPPSAAADATEQPAEGGFFAWLRGLGITRSSDRWLAGVSGGIAARVGIDPLIVRGVFLVLAILGGPGFLIYAAGWLLLPGRQGRIHAEDIIRGRAEPWVIGVSITTVAILFLPLLFGIGAVPFGGIWSWDVWGVPSWMHTVFSVLWWLALIAGITWVCVWFSTQGRASSAGAQRDRAAAEGDEARDRASTSGDESSAKATDSGEEFSAKATEWGEEFSTKATRWGENFSEKAAEWGQHVGEKSEEWSERVQHVHRARLLSPGYIIVTLAVALLAGGGAAIWSFTSAPFDATVLGDTHLAFVIGTVAAVAVLGVSMILAGARGKNPGWVGFFTSMGVVTLLFSAVFPQGTSFRPFGTDTFGLETDPAGVSMIAGTSHLDLTSLDDARVPARAGADTGDDEVEPAVWLFAGSSRITLPEDHPTIIDIGLFAGNIRVDAGPDADYRLSGPFLNRQIRVNMDDAREADAVRVDIRVAFGNVQVRGPQEARIENLWEESR